MTDKIPIDELLVCNCQKSMTLDGDRLAKDLGHQDGLAVRQELCRGEISVFEQALARCSSTGGRLHVACTQEAPLFREIAEEKGFGDTNMKFTNIRERAGWCESESGAGPKITALLKDAAYEPKPASLTTLTSQGVCLVYGAGQTALDVAQKLSAHLSVTLLLSNADDIVPPASINVPIYSGCIKSASGTLGAFEVIVDRYASMLPSSRAGLEFAMPRDGASSQCDLIFDLSGGTPLFTSHDHRDGYAHVDPNHPATVAQAMFDIIDYVGEFEKPLYVSYKKDICVHARSGQIGCTNCLDNCPTGALTPDGEHIKVDSSICGGCGNCSAVCPTGAISYTYPGRYDVIKRARGLLSSFRDAGGSNPTILLHDETHGSSLISAMARFGKGLPANMIPLSLYSVFQVGHEALSAMLSAGANHVCILAPPEKPDDLPSLESQTGLTNAFLNALGYEESRLHIITDPDPDRVEDALYSLPTVAAFAVSNFDPVGSKRDVARVALAKLHGAAPTPSDMIDLPEGAPYGTIHIDTKSCTLCLSCVGACPVGALADNPDRPQVAFTESACVQCGVCRVTCPENAITLSPRYNFTTAAQDANVLHSEDPFECIVCSKPFGTKSSVNKIVEKLKDHPMFKEGDQIKLIQMCDDCRIVTQANSNNDPFSGAARPLVRSTDDYVTAEENAKAGIKDPDDFLS